MHQITYNIYFLIQNILENDLTTKNQIREISHTLQESFDMGSNYLDNFDETRKNFQANETTDLETYLAENPEIEFFRSLLANFKEQQVKTKNITEFFTIGIFKLNFIGMKKKACNVVTIVCITTNLHHRGDHVKCHDERARHYDVVTS